MVIGRGIRAGAFYAPRDYPNRPVGSTGNTAQPNPQAGWYYYSGGTGNLTGVAGSACNGVNIGLTIVMGVQVGTGAAGDCPTKTSVGTWLTMTEIADPNNIISNVQNGGDLYIDLNSCTAPCNNLTTKWL